ncbi:hypothetical protein HYH02_006817 [Chlamydomonas schloesseri]|uniref:Uncharacterized protein n=1 Tax=Chlamydomonas schloesseri TaxID=2026947 RepID=A0A835WIY0_9CHLO|nr:hypothetical protein HYH02_006817 [Chlamydomonas schloesseri]|eukprot:KAG2448232.1 hypothetical protein HYH02_006817 [Chlamydomonas schloesseri]
MGNEGSKLDGGEEAQQRIVLEVPGNGTHSDRSNRLSATGGAPKSVGPERPGTTPSSKQWMRPSQARAAAASEARHAASKSVPPSARPKRPTNSSGGLDPPVVPAEMAAALAAETAYQTKLENSKKELAKKLAVQIKSMNTKDAASLAPSRPPVAKGSGLLKGSEGKPSWLTKLTKGKAAALEAVKDKMAAGKYLEPMSQEQVGDRVEDSLGGSLEPFGNFQGALHDIMEAGVSDDVLDQFFFDEEEERVLPTYQKWQIIRHAAEQVLAVYANRSNSQWIEDESWAPPNVVNTTAASASMYANAVDAAITQGNIALLFIDDGRLAEMGGDEVSPLVAADLWQAIKELAPHRVPSGQRLERLSVAGRHLLHAAVSVEMWYGAAALRQVKVVMAIDCDCEYFVVNELQQWNFFGLHHSNVVLLPLPRFHGFAQDMRSGHLAHVKGSPRLMLGTGYAMFLLNSPAEAYTLSADGSEPQCLQGSVLEWLLDSKASWLYTGLFSDVERLRPEALFDMDFLAAAMAAADRTGCNMAVEVMMGEREREARLHDSVVLSRLTRNTGASGASGPAQGYSRGSATMPPSTSPSGAGEPPLAPANCNLRVSSMRTVKSYKLLSSTAANPHGFYIATHRYAFSVKALQRMLVDPAAFHADVYLQGFYAYATFDISDLTTFRAANCACILGTQGLRAPIMSEVIYGKDWLSAAATVLQLQDNVKEFRRKAMQLYDHGRTAAAAAAQAAAAAAGAHPGAGTGPMAQAAAAAAAAGGGGLGSAGAGGRPGSTYREKQGYNVLLVFTPDHARLVRPAIRLARLFVHNIVDRLHVVLVCPEAESKTRIRELLEQAVDKELDFHQQLLRDVALRVNGASVTEVVAGLLGRVQANMLVIPSERLCPTGTSADLGQLAGSSALALARAISSVPLLVVKANTIGKYLTIPSAMNPNGAPSASERQSPSNPLVARASVGVLARSESRAALAGKDSVCALVHLDTTSVGPLVEFVSGALAGGGTDQLVLARTTALERDGGLSMRSRRVFVQARMAVAQALRVEERAYAGSGLAELPKAVEAEGADLLALSCPPDLAISKEMEQLLQACRTSVLIHRAMTAAPGASSAAWS